MTKQRLRILDRKYPPSLLLTHEVQKEDFSNAINSVRAGKVIGED
jgi:hypothetical protein